MNWTNSCLNSYNRLPDDNLGVLYSCGGITVSPFEATDFSLSPARPSSCYTTLHCSVPSRLTRLSQIAAYFLSAVAGGIMFTRWLRVDAEEKACVWPAAPPLEFLVLYLISRRNLWPLYGWLSGLICFASCAGIVYISALIATLEGIYKNVEGNRAFSAVVSIFLVGGMHHNSVVHSAD